MEFAVVILGRVTLAVIVSTIILFGLQHASIKSQYFRLSDREYRAALRSVEKRFLKVMLFASLLFLMTLGLASQID
jgi:hypothetical protein